jgi:formate dehydrogenase iron-sulfur subunit
MLKLARARLKAVKAKYPQAMLADPDEVSVIYLVGYAPNLYFEHVLGATDAFGVTRQMAFKRLLRPFKRAAAHLG